MSDNPSHMMQRMLTDMRKDGHLTDEQVDTLYDRFMDVYTDAHDWANCDHEDVRTSVDPTFGERNSIAALIDGADEGDSLATFHAECVDCGADLSSSLVLEVERGEDDD